MRDSFGVVTSFDESFRTLTVRLPAPDLADVAVTGRAVRVSWFGTQPVCECGPFETGAFLLLAHAESVSRMLADEKASNEQLRADLDHVTRKRDELLGILSTPETVMESMASGRIPTPKIILAFQEHDAELRKLKAIIADPGAVWVNMLRGEIAMPDFVRRAEEDSRGF